MTLLIFTGGSGPDSGKIHDFIESLGAVDHVIAADSGVDRLLEYNREYKDEKLVPDLILGDMDSISGKKALEAFPEAEVRMFSEYKDYTDTELALLEAYNLRLWDKKECKTKVSHGSFIKHIFRKTYGLGFLEKNSKDLVVVVGGDGGRIDHLLCNYETFGKKWHPHIWLGQNQALHYIHKGQCLKFEGIKPMESISVARLFGDAGSRRFKTQGLEWEGKVFFKKGMPSISNRIAGTNSQGVFWIKAQKGRAVVIVPLGAKRVFSES